MTQHEKVQATIDQLEAGLITLSESDTYRAYLDMVAQFHSYSANNCALIMFQRPDASKVAGFKAWQGMGRQVQKGERSIKILAPMTRTIEDETTGEKVRIVRGFRAVSVFDVGQTEGDDLAPDIATLLEGAAPADAYAKLASVAEREGIPITREPSRHGENGYYVPTEKRINISADLSDAQAVKTLAHELGHHFTETTCARADGEIIAESVAYVVSDALGLDSGDYTFGYALGWADGDLDKIRATLGDVQRVSHTLLTALEAA
jgi:antirestriction protein ArdC